MFLATYRRFAVCGLLILTLGVLATGSAADTSTGSLAVAESRCEYVQNPLAVDADRPRFSWTLASDKRDQRQSEYQILVATSPERLEAGEGDRWDSGRVESDRSVNVPYDGAKLKSGDVCYWKVRVWDGDGRPSAWSKPAMFAMGLLSADDWKGDWIGLSPDGEMAFVDGAFGKAVDLAGGIQSLRVEHYPGLKPQKQITIAAWIKPRAGKDEWQSIYRKEDGVARHVLAIGKTGKQFGVWAGFGIGRQYIETGVPLKPSDLTDGKFHHVAVTFDGQDIVLYVDGAKRHSQSAEGPLNNRGRASAFIGSNNGTTEPFDGAIDDVCIFPVALSAEAVGKLFAGKAVDEEPAGRWQFDGDLSNVAKERFGRATGFRAVPAEGNAAVAVYNNDRLPSPLLRKEFTLDKEVKSAKAYFSGLGWSELYLNGQKVSDHVLDPAATDYQKHVLYVTYDVSRLLRRGPNAIGAMLGNGWFCEPADQKYANSPRMLLQLNIEFTDGTTTSIVSDSSWKSIAGPVVKNSMWRGEEYDARREQAGWTKAGFADASWKPATVRPGPTGVLTSQMMPAIKVNQTLEPISLTNPEPGIYVYDLGQHFGGWARVKFKGPAGKRVTIRYSERLNESTGLVNQKIHISGAETDYYTLKGDPQGEMYEPHFDFHPVRYVQLEGYPGEPTISDLVGCAVYSDVDLSAKFECSNPLLNQIHKNIRWTQTNGLFGFPLDCLHRELIAPIDPATVTGNLYPRPYMPLFWTKWLNDMRDAQRPDGAMPDIAPDYFVYGGGQSDVAWGGNYPLLVWFVYQYYDDRRVVEEHFEPVERWMAYLAAHADADHQIHGHYGDHLVPGPGPGDEQFMSKETPPELVWMGYYYRGAYVAAKMAELLGETDKAKKYATLADSIAKSYNRKWFDPKTNNYSTGSPTANLFPLALGIVPNGRAQKVADNASQMLLEKYDGHVHTGNTGTTCMIDTLAAYGHGETIYGAATKTTFPGWGYMVVNGATTIWENWGRERSKSGRGGQESMIMWGTLDEFFYNDLAGIKGPDYYGSAAFAPGFKQIEIRPYVLGELTYADGSIPTTYGTIASGWRKDGDKLTLKVTIPANCQAKVSVPKLGHKHFQISETKTPVWKYGKYLPGGDGIHSARDEAEHVTFNVGSGSYEFTLSPSGAEGE